MRRGEDPADGGRRREDVGVGLEADVDAVHVVAELAVVVSEPEQRGAGRDVQHVVAILPRQAGELALRNRLGSGDADCLIPLPVHFDKLSERIGQSEQAHACGFAQHAHRRGMRRLLRREEAA